MNPCSSGPTKVSIGFKRPVKPSAARKPSGGQAEFEENCWTCRFRFGDSGCHGFGVFDRAVFSSFKNAFEKHGLTADGKTVAPIIEGFCSKSISAPTADEQFVAWSAAGTFRTL